MGLSGHLVLVVLVAGYMLCLELFGTIYGPTLRLKCLQPAAFFYLVCFPAMRAAATFAGIDKFCAKVVFTYSQSTVIDELKKRQRAISLVFFDFVEVSVLGLVQHLMCSATHDLLSIPCRKGRLPPSPVTQSSMLVDGISSVPFNIGSGCLGLKDCSWTQHQGGGLPCVSSFSIPADNSCSHRHWRDCLRCSTRPRLRSCSR